MTNEELAAWIKHYEGFCSHPYLDTVGKLTIGYGRNLDDNGLTQKEADYLLLNDIEGIKSDLMCFPWFSLISENSQCALINMCFNMGLGQLLKFKKMIDALIKKDYVTASREALNSEWARQVGQRATDVALMIRKG